MVARMMWSSSGKSCRGYPSTASKQRSLLSIVRSRPRFARRRSQPKARARSKAHLRVDVCRVGNLLLRHTNGIGTGCPTLGSPRQETLGGFDQRCGLINSDFSNQQLGVGGPEQRQSEPVVAMAGGNPGAVGRGMNPVSAVSAVLSAGRAAGAPRVAGGTSWP